MKLCEGIEMGGKMPRAVSSGASVVVVVVVVADISAPSSSRADPMAETQVDRQGESATTSPPPK